MKLSKDLSVDELKKIVATNDYKVLRKNYEMCKQLCKGESISSPLIPIGMKRFEDGVELFNVDTEKWITSIPDFFNNTEVGYSIIDALNTLEK